MFWEIIKILHYLISILGIVFHILFIRFVIFSKVLDGYCRTTSFLISTGQLSVLFSYPISMSICFSMGFEFEQDECVYSNENKIFRLIHIYGEYTTIGPLFILICDRLISVRFFKFHGSKQYQYIFFSALIFHCILLLTYIRFLYFGDSDLGSALCLFSKFIIVIFCAVFSIYIKCVSKTVYYDNQGKVPLGNRYKISQSYEIIKSYIPPILFSVFLKIIIFAIATIFLVKQIDIDGKAYMIYSLFLNTEALVFPILIIYLHRLFRNKISVFFNLKKVSNAKNIEVHALTGAVLNNTRTQEQYFDGLKSTWN